MFRSKRSCLGFVLGAGLSVTALAYALIYLLTGKLLVPGDAGARLITAREAATELDTLVTGSGEANDES